MFVSTGSREQKSLNQKMLGQSCPTLHVGYHDHSSKAQIGDKAQKMFSTVSLSILGQTPEMASNVPVHGDHPVIQC